MLVQNRELQQLKGPQPHLAETLTCRLSAHVLPCWVDARDSDHFCFPCPVPWAPVLWLRAAPLPSAESHRV